MLTEPESKMSGTFLVSVLADTIFVDVKAQKRSEVVDSYFRHRKRQKERS